MSLTLQDVLHLFVDFIDGNTGHAHPELRDAVDSLDVGGAPAASPDPAPVSEPSEPDTPNAAFGSESVPEVADPASEVVDAPESMGG